MKKFILQVILIFTVFTQSYAQDYKALLDNVNEWHFTSCNSGCLTDVYYTNGDTIVDGLSYKVLDGYHYISRTFLLREVIAEKSVYLKYFNSGGSREYLLYDFAMNVGDSIDMKNIITPFETDAGYYQLDSIVGRPLVDGNLYKHYYLSPTSANTISSTNAVWVEGVGSLSLINAPSGNPDINGVGALSCAFKNSELFYSNLDSISGCVPVILSSENIESTLKDVSITTLTKNGQCQISNAEMVKFIDVFDISGKKLFTTENAGQNSFVLDLNTLSSGLYIVILSSENFQRKTFKILVD